jgi:hypothetical protein
MSKPVDNSNRLGRELIRFDGTTPSRLNLIVCGILGLRALAMNLYIHDLGFRGDGATFLDMAAY